MKKGVQYRILLSAITVVIVIAFFVSFACGRYSAVQMKDVFQALGHFLFGDFISAVDRETELVVFQLRMPRILGAMLVGAALSIAGASYQTLFSNPIASPDTLGVSNAASFGAVLGILMGVGAAASKIIAFTFGVGAVLIVFLAATRIDKGRNLTIHLLLIGMVVSSVFSALLSVAKYVADPDDQLPQITYWLMGSMSKITMQDIKSYAFFFVVGLIPLLLLRWRMNLLSLSDAEILSIGENSFMLRAVTVLCATLLTAASTAMTGGISWVGLIIPHIVRHLVGTDARKVLPMSGLLGALFLLIMDNLARSISINELPISILTSLIGAPIFFVTLLQNRGGHVDGC